jgi:hypothetical protein
MTIWAVLGYGLAVGLMLWTAKRASVVVAWALYGFVAGVLLLMLVARQWGILLGLLLLVLYFRRERVSDGS